MNADAKEEWASSEDQNKFLDDMMQHGQGVKVFKEGVWHHLPLDQYFINPPPTAE